MEFRPILLESIPRELEPGVLYISLRFRVAMHLCACGCGNRVVTPLSPKGWRLIFDGSFSLYPSIGNWSFPCQSHYWIRNESVIWSESWSKEMIDKARERDEVGDRTLAPNFAEMENSGTVDPPEDAVPVAKKKNQRAKRRTK